MSEMKMSDVFAMNVTLENSAGEGLLLKDNNCEYEEEYLAIIFDSNQARAITTAINNHDSLVEEVERLRGDRDELVKFAEEHKRWIPLAQYPFAIMEIDKLLAKIKGEDNE